MRSQDFDRDRAIQTSIARTAGTAQHVVSPRTLRPFSAVSAL